MFHMQFYITWAVSSGPSENGAEVILVHTTPMSSIIQTHNTDIAA